MGFLKTLVCPDTYNRICGIPNLPPQIEKSEEALKEEADKKEIQDLMSKIYDSLNRSET